VFADRASEPDERCQAAAGQAREEPVDQLIDNLDGEAGGEDRANHLFHRPGARYIPAGGVQPHERVELGVGEVVGVLEQRPAAAFELLGGVFVAGLAELVPVLAADFVKRLGSELHDVKVVDADDGLGGVLADRFGVPAGHVHRDRGEHRGALPDVALGVVCVAFRAGRLW